MKPRRERTASIAAKLAAAAAGLVLGALRLRYLPPAASATLERAAHKGASQ